MNAIGQRSFHGSARLKGAEYRDRFDGCERQRGGHVGRDPSQAQDLNAQPFSGFLHAFQIGTREFHEAQHQRLAEHCLSDRFGMRRNVIADSSANEVGAVGIEPFLHEEIDLAQVDKA